MGKESSDRATNDNEILNIAEGRNECEREEQEVERKDRRRVGGKKDRRRVGGKKEG